jgi:hypothetical protein
VINTGSALFNDQPARHGNATYVPNTFDMDSAPNKAGAFFIVDNNNTACFDDADYASLYGEAMVIQLAQGAAWGYVGYNGIGGGPGGPASEPKLGFNDGLDMQGEVLRSPRFFDVATSDGEELEVTPTVLLPTSVFTTKMFVTPVNYALWEAEDGFGAPYTTGPGARFEAANSRIQFCLRPLPASTFPLGPTCDSGLGGLTYAGDNCQSNGAAKCQIGGIYDNDEGPMDSNIAPDVVCTSALDISVAGLLLTQAQIDYLQSGAQGWTYVRSMVGTIGTTPTQISTRPLSTLSDSIVGKLEYTSGTFQFGNATIPGSVNDMKWIRNSASQYDVDWDMFRGINAIGSETWDQNP